MVRALAQLQKRSAGDLVLDGQPAARRGRGLRAYRHEVQLVFQDPFASLNPMHTVRHHLARPLLLRPDRPHGSAVEQAVHELLRSVNLTPPGEVAAKHPHELSGGQRQRVAIARALAPGPGVLLADEPVSMLDVSIRLEILNLLDRLKRDRNLAMLYVTHDLATARHFSAEIMVMYRGEIVEHGPSGSVILSPAHPYIQILASAAPDPRASRRTWRPRGASGGRSGRPGEPRCGRPPSAKAAGSGPGARTPCRCARPIRRTWSPRPGTGPCAGCTHRIMAVVPPPRAARPAARGGHEPDEGNPSKPSQRNATRNTSDEFDQDCRSDL
jgi:peptide/nickel transport system ATP-binding protein